MTTTLSAPAFAPPLARRVTWPVASWVATTAAAALVVAWLAYPLNQLLLDALAAAANLAAAVVLFARARRTPREARGWYLLASACMVLVGVNVAAGLELWFPHVGGPGYVYLFGAVSVAQLLGLGGLVAWPWRAAKTRRRLLHALGAAMFVGSFMLFLSLAGSLIAHGGGDDLASTRGGLLFSAIRVSVLGGVALYLLAEDPRRVHGALGWVLLFTLIGGAYVALLRAAVELGRAAVDPFLVIGATAPLALAIGAWSGAPVEVVDDRTGSHPRGWDLLPYAPFLLVTLTVVVSLARDGAPDPLSTLAYVALTLLLLARQFLLLREQRRSQTELEERVAERTHKMESLQAVISRTERLNTFAALGAGLAHDINNMLTAVYAAVRRMQSEVATTGAPQERTLGWIVDSTERAAALAGKVMAYAGRAPGSVLGQPAGTVVESLRDLLRLFLPRGIELVLEVDPAATSLLVDGHGLEQVLVNLVSNARDAIEGGRGRVTVSLRPGDTVGGRPAVLVEVADTGAGMSDEVRARVFEPFFTTKAAGHGTGLGLPSVKAIVEQQGGSIEVESSPGAGARFTVRYPVAHTPVTGRA